MTDPTQVLVVHHGAQYMKKLRDRIAEHAGSNAEVHHMHVDQVLKQPEGHFKQYKGIAFSGGDGSINTKAYERIAQEANPNTTIVGVCHGAQTIAQAHGGTVEKLDKHIRGQQQANVTQAHDIVGEKGATLEYHQNHKYAITNPGELEVLAKRNVGTEQNPQEIVEVFKHPEKPIYGIQGHPEKGQGIETLHNIMANVYTPNQKNIHDFQEHKDKMNKPQYQQPEYNAA